MTDVGKHLPSHKDHNGGDNSGQEDKATKSSQCHNGAQIEFGLSGFLVVGILHKIWDIYIR